MSDTPTSALTPTDMRTVRGEVLTMAAKAVLRDRNTQYGPPEDSFRGIAEMWSAYLGAEVTSLDVANLLLLMKVSRSQASPDKIDHYVDMAGYAACAAEVAGVGVDE